MLIQASRGARQATKTVHWPESQRRHAHRQGTARAEQTGGVTHFTDRDSRQEKQQDCRNHKEGERRPGQSQMERAMARKKTGGDLDLADGAGRWVTQRGRGI